jgi:hypothetical protein
LLHCMSRQRAEMVSAKGLGHEARQAKWASQGQGRRRPQARGHPASHVGRQNRGYLVEQGQIRGVKGTSTRRIHQSAAHPLQLFLNRSQSAVAIHLFQTVAPMGRRVGYKKFVGIRRAINNPSRSVMFDILAASGPSNVDWQRRDGCEVCKHRGAVGRESR